MRRKTRPSTRGRRSPRSLAVSEGFRDFVVDQLGELGAIVARSMFGGVGLYCDGLFFGIIARNVLYLKVDDENRSRFERAGMNPFKPYPDQPGTMNYYEVPVGVLENAPELVTWAADSVAAARRAGGRKAT